MILLDFSGLLHQQLHGVVNMVNPREDETGQYITSEYSGQLIGVILSTIFDLNQSFHQYAPTPRDFVICLDDKVNWRKDILSTYKGNRAAQRQQSKINYPEVFEHIEHLTDVLRNDLPYRVVKGTKAEGDDTILVLCERYAKKERILIISSDKDMIQATKFGDVKQYSMLTRRFMNYGTKGELSLDDWLLDHVALGDACDCVPKVVDDTVFSVPFKEFLSTKGIELTPRVYWNLKQSTRDHLLNAFDTAYPGSSIFTKVRFGAKTLRKQIEKLGGLDQWLDSNDLYREHWRRNEVLVLAEGIPDFVRNSVLSEFEHSSTRFNEQNLQGFLRKYNLDQMIFNLPSDLYKGQELNASVFDLSGS